jgi:hypothetical protein
VSRGWCGRLRRGVASRVGASAPPLRAALALAALAFTLAVPVQAQTPGATLRISVLTFGPGDAVFERFGHNALRVQDSATGLDLAYNWGMFSFDEPNFLGRFLSGDTRYWVEAFPTPKLLEYYAQQDRESIEQELALTPAQRAEVAALVAENALEANKYYRYDYFLDNCSTRLRDVLDRVLGGSLQGRFTPLRTEWTFRSESVRLTTPDALAQAGIDIALGPRADIPITAWESMFIPMRLRDYLREVTVPLADGRTEPFVRDERVLYRAQRPAEPDVRRGLTLGAWGPVLGAWMLILAPVSVASRRRSRVPAAVMAALFYAITGVLGLLLAGMWIGSAHVFWYNNWNLLLLSPLGLVAAVPAALAVLNGALSRRTAILLGILAGGAALAALLAPFISQRMAGPLLLILPAHLGLAIAIWRHTRPASVSPAASSAASRPAPPPAATA